MENNQELVKRIAILESLVDHLQTEIGYLNDIFVRYGFEGGLPGIKEAMETILHDLENP